jgi:hypothetical protein
MAEWLVREGTSPPIGPVSTELVLRGLETGRVSASAEVCRVGTRDWLAIDLVDEFASAAMADADDEAATRVTDSPWFMEQQSQAVAKPPAPPDRPSQGSLGLPPPPPRQAGAPARQGTPPQPALRSVPRAHPPPPPAPAARPHPPPAPAARPHPAPARPADARLAPGARAYGDVDDEARTRVASSPDQNIGPDEFDDETMTRVAAPKTASGVIGGRPKRAGLLKTAPMQEVVPIRPAAGAPPPVMRPAAGAEMDSAIQLRADLEPRPGMPAPPPGYRPLAGGFQAPPPHMQGPVGPSAPSPFGPTFPAGVAPPAAYQQPPPMYPYPQQQPAEPAGDGGVKALIALIVVLFVALMVVLILLVLRR